MPTVLFYVTRFPKVRVTKTATVEADLLTNWIHTFTPLAH